MAEEKLKFDCKERVALDMTLIIWAKEDILNEKNCRKEFFKLYSQCHKAVSGFGYSQIIEED
jgi:hypothetical protein